MEFSVHTTVKMKTVSANDILIIIAPNTVKICIHTNLILATTTAAGNMACHVSTGTV